MSQRGRKWMGGRPQGGCFKKAKGNKNYHVTIHIICVTMVCEKRGLGACRGAEVERSDLTIGGQANDMVDLCIGGIGSRHEPGIHGWYPKGECDCRRID